MSEKGERVSERAMDAADAVRAGDAAADEETPVVRVSAAVVVDERGLTLVVRKHGASVFQQPGGKPDPGETPVETVRREVAEEIGVHADLEDYEPLGRFSDAAANEPGHRVVADAFRLRIRHDQAAAAAEIAELRWVAPDEVDSVPLAPLSRRHLLDFAWR
ncbi:NUDIX domain-containing protein [Microbacterium sp. SORGH_AS_0888]|uniref:NUDIX hydrolase n=1 Tax=Microbacterium sp. SORGH_AS_0888 TaxID=3041791 RepID=UPI0027D8DE40|nr:NUDIX domain-containing protein [Microbacterium sp. SORGH_AS_0888]